MKKLLYIGLVLGLLFVSSKLLAGDVSEYKTISLSSGVTFISSGSVTIDGMIVSSNTASTDYVVFYATGNPGFTTGTEIARVPLSTDIATFAASGFTMGVNWKPPKSIRSHNGLCAKVSVATINSTTILFTPETKR